MDDRVKVAEAIGAIDFIQPEWPDSTKIGMELTAGTWRTILAALRSTGTGRSEAEAKDAAAKVCHDEQMTVWSGEIVDRLAMGDHLPGDISYEDTLAIHAAVADGIKGVVESAFCHPELRAIPAQTAGGGDA